MKFFQNNLMEVGLNHTSHLVVGEEHTAQHLGSGNLPVLATPAMLALMENAAMLAVAPELPEGCTTVGGHIASSHLAPSPVGMAVSATAELTAVEGRKLTFRIEATDARGKLLGQGTHLRFIVEEAKFLRF